MPTPYGLCHLACTCWHDPPHMACGSKAEGAENAVWSGPVRDGGGRFFAPLVGQFSSVSGSNGGVRVVVSVWMWPCGRGFRRGAQKVCVFRPLGGVGGGWCAGVGRCGVRTWRGVCVPVACEGLCGRWGGEGWVYPLGVWRRGGEGCCECRVGEWNPCGRSDGMWVVDQTESGRSIRWNPGGRSDGIRVVDWRGCRREGWEPGGGWAWWTAPEGGWGKAGGLIV